MTELGWRSHAKTVGSSQKHQILIDKFGEKKLICKRGCWHGDIPCPCMCHSEKGLLETPKERDLRLAQQLKEAEVITGMELELNNSINDVQGYRLRKLQAAVERVLVELEKRGGGK